MSIADVPDPVVRRSAGRDGESGVALVLALIFAILLYVLVAELVVSGRMVRATGENDALLARMRNQMLYQLADAGEQLLADMAGQAAADEGGGGGAGGLANALANGGGATGGGGAAAEEEEEDPSTKCDSSRDAWFQPVAHADDDLTTYVWVEDENRKFNLLALWSPDEKFAETSKKRLVRLIDTLREDSDYDVTTSDAERIVQELKDWVARGGSDQLPRPVLKSDDPKRREVTALMHLDELLMLPSVTEDLFFDKVIDGKVYLGLEAVLTIWTSLRVDPGDPEKVARQRAAAEARGEKPAAGAGAAGQTPAQPGGSTPQGGTGQQPGGESDAPPQPDGLGIRINVNTASRAVLRAVASPEAIPDRVIDAIVKYRNEVDEEEEEKEAEKTSATDPSEFGDLKLANDQKLKFFETLEDLDQVEEFADLQDSGAKEDFKRALTTRSEVFTIHLATLYKRNEENRVYVLRRARSIVLRLDDGEDGQIIPLIAFEDRTGLRVRPVDLQDEYVDRTALYSEMDRFAQEEQAWNPFLVDFYLPKQRREEFYRPR